MYAASTPHTIPPQVVHLVNQHRPVLTLWSDRYGMAPPLSEHNFFCDGSHHPPGGGGGGGKGGDGEVDLEMGLLSAEGGGEGRRGGGGGAGLISGGVGHSVNRIHPLV